MHYSANMTSLVAYFRRFWVAVFLLEPLCEDPNLWIFCIACCIFALEILAKYKFSESRVYSRVRVVAASSLRDVIGPLLATIFCCKLIIAAFDYFYREIPWDTTLDWLANFQISKFALSFYLLFVADGLREAVMR